jgi:serine/threonine protein kinase
VHRDVKPSNILIADDNRIVLSDLGIARIGDDAGLTSTGFTIGTAAYLAPEQLQGAPVGPDADVYALGLVLAECLTGHRVFDGGPEEAAFARLTHDPDFSDLPNEGWRHVLESMTARDAAARVTAADAVARLARLVTTNSDATSVLAAPTAETSVMPVPAPGFAPATAPVPLPAKAPANRDHTVVRRCLVACIVVPLVLLALAALAVSGANSGELVPPTTAPPTTTAPPSTTVAPPTTVTTTPPATTPATTAPTQDGHAKPEKKEPPKKH